MRDLARILLAAAPGTNRETDYQLFVEAGYDVQVVSTGAGTSPLPEEQPDLVVLHRFLADEEDSLPVLRALKAEDDRFVPVLVIAAGATSAERVLLLQAGADEVVSRPLEPAELLARTKTLLRFKSTHDRVRKVQHDLELLVISDPLTGLNNRRALHDKLKHEFERYARYKQPLAVAMIDLDGFKPINDRYGHLIGDRVLRAVSGALQHSVRSLDVAARYGGDEFAVVLPQTDAPGALRVGERIVKNISALRVPTGSGDAEVSASLGLAFYPEGGLDTPEDLLRAADQALYRAKKQGKNRLCAVRSVDAEDPLAVG